MKIAVIAASGRSGQAFTRLALAAGCEIRAGVRASNHLPPNSGLTALACDATKLADIRRLLDGADAVVSLIGHVKNSPPDLQTTATKNILEAMKELGLHRIVSLTGTGVRFQGDHITLVDRLLNLGINVIDPARVQDGKSHIEVLQASGLDWTVIRVLKLQNTKPQPYRLTERGPAKLITSREEVAQAILEVLENTGFIQRAPIIGKV